MSYGLYFFRDDETIPHVSLVYFVRFHVSPSPSGTSGDSTSESDMNREDGHSSVDDRGHGEDSGDKGDGENGDDEVMNQSLHCCM